MPVTVATTGTVRFLVGAAVGVDFVAANTVKDDAAAFGFETGVIAAIIIDPQAEKKCREEEAVEDGGSGEVEHGGAVPYPVGASDRVTTENEKWMAGGVKGSDRKK